MSPIDVSSANQLLPIMARGPKNYDFGQTQQARQRVLAIQQAEQELAAYPEERNWLREAHGMKRQEFKRETEAYNRKLERQGFDDEKEAIGFMEQWAPHINLNNYEDTRRRFIKYGLSPDMLPQPEFFHQEAQKQGVSPEQYFNGWKQENLLKQPKVTLSPDATKYRDYLNISEDLKKKKIRTAQDLKKKLSDSGIDLPNEDLSSFIDASFADDEKKLDQVFGLTQKPTTYKPELFVFPNGKQTWVNPGEEPPKGAVPYEKPQAEPRASDFDKKWSLSRKMAKEKLGRVPSDSEIADIYKSKFGTAGLLELFGLGAPTETTPGARPTPKF
jgi:hypothetical protein